MNTPTRSAAHKAITLWTIQIHEPEILHLADRMNRAREIIDSQPNVSLHRLFARRAGWGGTCGRGYFIHIDITCTASDAVHLKLVLSY